jgi:hypothetical protein
MARAGDDRPTPAQTELRLCMKIRKRRKTCRLSGRPEQKVNGILGGHRLIMVPIMSVIVSMVVMMIVVTVIVVATGMPRDHDDNLRL